MRVFILDKEKITKYNLPNKISGAFAFDYTPPDSKVARTINIEANDNNWIIKNNESVEVLNLNTASTNTTLQEHSIYQLKIKGIEDIITLYCMGNIDNNSKRYAPNQSVISVGNAANNSIMYVNKFILPNNFAISKQQDGWYITAAESDTTFAYLNNKRIKQSKIYPGDVIFLYGLKIIWMENFLQINKPLDRVEINAVSLVEYNEYDEDIKKIEPVSEEDLAKELYTEKDYFFHTPRLKQSLVKYEVAIDSPPGKQTSDELPLLLTMGTQISMFASTIFSGYSAFNTLTRENADIVQGILQLIMFVSLLIGSIIIPRVLQKYQKNIQIKKEKERQEKYTKYLNTKEQEIKDELNNQKFILENNYPSIAECYNKTINLNKSSIWQREIKDDDFLRIKLGTGNRKANIEISGLEKHFKMENDNLEDRLINITENMNTLENVPITFSFLEKNISAIICNLKNADDYINGMLLQLFYYHSAKELKIVFLLDDNTDINFEYAKYAPHCLSEDKSTRYYATNQDDIKKISSLLSNELQERKTNKESEEGQGKKYLSKLPYYLIITNNYSAIKNVKIIEDILKEKENYGFSIAFLEKSLQSLPNECSSFIELFENESCVLENDLNNQTIFKPEIIQNMDMRKAINQLANVPIEIADQAHSLPTMISFLEMLNAAKIEHLNILNKWKTNDPTISLKAPIGVHTNGDLFYLDLHEKYHGPHGLIAGMTGSGKSEFIITYLLSLAVNYHPDEVQFVLIDYKGGGLAGAFENRDTGIKIPHVVGTITNLDTNEMNRSLVSINSELKRRQQMFNKAKTITGESTIDIYKYQHYYREGVLKEPIAHLFIVSDEFAELRTQQPEFMSELISAARIGRSLGVHLILATQKPAGVVNDQIWSNSKFKVCLKVQDRSDSMEMLKRPEAASIKETGRFYLQVGYDEYFDIGQSAWAGAKYIPSDTVKKKIDDSIKIINNIGETVKDIQETIINKEENPQEKRGDQLTNIVKYLYNIAKEENYTPNKLWLDNIPEYIYLQDLKKKYNYQETTYNINPIIGEYDNPAEQMQGLLTLNITDRNTLIYGMPDSGKETLLSTLIYSTITNHGPNEVNFYIVDCGAETLKLYQKAPQVGDVCTVNDQDKIFNMFLMIEKELDRRKELFSDYNGTYKEYCRLSQEKLPVINIIINGYEIFTENMSKIADLLSPMYRDSAKYGITFTIATGAANSFSSRLSEYFLNKMCMKMANDTDYRGILDSARGLIPSNYHARGICGIDDLKYEFQTAYIGDKDKTNDIIRATIKKLNEICKTKAPRTPIVPDIVKIEDLLPEVKGLNSVPFGYSMISKQPFGYDFTKNNINLFLYNSIENNKDFIYLLSQLIKSIENTTIVTLDFKNELNQNNLQSEYINNSFVEKIPKLIQESQTSQKQNICIINGISYAKNVLKNNIDIYTKLIQMLINKKVTVIMFDEYESFKEFRLEPFYKQVINPKEAIWIGEGLSSQIVIDTDGIPQEYLSAAYDDMAFIISNGNATPIKKVTNREENTNE